MARVADTLISELDPGWVLSPERYDPLRRGPAEGVPLAQVAKRVGSLMRPDQADPEGRFLILDTSHAREGWVLHPPEPGGAERIGSAKRQLQVGDLIVSRLRTYLRQVAWIDPGLGAPGLTLLSSTEFVVLRPTDGQSLAFLVPYLLSEPVQAALAAAQEGGHHPRVPLKLFDGLRVPAGWLEQRQARSEEVEAAISAARGAGDRLAGLVAAVEAQI